MIRFCIVGMTNNIPVSRYEWVTDGHPICETLCLRIRSNSTVNSDLANRLEFVPMTIELDNQEIVWRMSGAYLTNILSNGQWIDMQFLYPLETKRFSRSQGEVVRKPRLRSPVEWFKWGF